MIQQIVRAIDENKSILKVPVLDAMKMLTIRWEDVTEETFKKYFDISRILSKYQVCAQNDLQILAYLVFLECSTNRHVLS